MKFVGTRLSLDQRDLQRLQAARKTWETVSAAFPSVAEFKLAAEADLEALAAWAQLTEKNFLESRPLLAHLHDDPAVKPPVAVGPQQAG